MHVPVMLNEMIQALRPSSPGIYLDGNLGAGGYSKALLDNSCPDGIVVGVDLDSQAVEACKMRLSEYGDRFKAVHGGYHEAGEILKDLGINSINGAVLDLGLSLDQLEDAERGFSFKHPGPLDMRFDESEGANAIELLKRLSVKELEHILSTYGEERYSKKLAKGIRDAVNRGLIKTALDLAELITKLMPGPRGKIHPATRTFQALRIAVNGELENLDTGLRNIPSYILPEGRFCVVSYHSLEDRLVKLAFKSLKREGWNLVTESPLTPSDGEKRSNPRSRSAKMRVIEAGYKVVGQI